MKFWNGQWRLSAKDAGHSRQFFDCERDRCVAECKTCLTAFITPRREITPSEGRSNHILAIWRLCCLSWFSSSMRRNGSVSWSRYIKNNERMEIWYEVAFLGCVTVYVCWMRPGWYTVTDVKNYHLSRVGSSSYLNHFHMLLCSFIEVC